MRVLLFFRFSPLATAAVAPYHLAVDNSTKVHFTVIILFNPFVAEDVVYMKGRIFIAADYLFSCVQILSKCASTC